MALTGSITVNDTATTIDSIVGILPQGNTAVPMPVALDSLLKPNTGRQVITDVYVSQDVTDSKAFAFNVYVRLNVSTKVTFRNVSFQHCIFDGCYFKNCVFDSCDFTGCRFLGSNLHLCTFTGCKFEFATFERTQIDDDILTSEAPLGENLRMRFARSLRMNFQQIGDARAVNKAISVELEATSIYLWKSWGWSRETYYKQKFDGIWKPIRQFFRWLEFKTLDVIWGNGESIKKLTRSIVVAVALVSMYETIGYKDPMSVIDYWTSVKDAPGIFLGVVTKEYPSLTLALIVATRYVSLALLTALLIKRFGRR